MPAERDNALTEAKLRAALKEIFDAPLPSVILVSVDGMRTIRKVITNRVKDAREYVRRTARAPN